MDSVSPVLTEAEVESEQVVALDQSNTTRSSLPGFCSKIKASARWCGFDSPMKREN